MRDRPALMREHGERVIRAGALAGGGGVRIDRLHLAKCPAKPIEIVDCEGDQHPARALMVHKPSVRAAGSCAASMRPSRWRTPACTRLDEVVRATKFREISDDLAHATYPCRVLGCIDHSACGFQGTCQW